MTTHLISTKNFSMPRIFLHLEGLALLITSLVLYGQLNFSWGAFALFLLAPDLPMLVYLVNAKAGSIAYNIVHVTILPMALGVISVIAENMLGLQVTLIWFAHIGMDHAFGYGLKYMDQFKETHFSRI